MDPNVDVDEIRRKADTLLQGLLERSAARPPPEVAHSITSLAFEEANPVRDLFLNAGPIDHSVPPPVQTSSSHSLKSRASSKFLRLARREPKPTISEGKAPASAQQVAGSSSTQASSDGRPPTAVSTFSTAEKPGNETSSVQYNCIICHDDMSSKGVCKRHLEEQHVLPKTFKCERCGENFTTKGDAKKHCNRCGLGVFTYSIVKPPSKKIYASEFTEEWFSSKQSYLEHLLKLSRKDATRLRPSLHCKLRALLGHPSLLPHANTMSKRLVGSSMAWRSMRWSDEQLQAAITQLEDAAVLQENGSVDFGGDTASTQQPFDARSFLQDLLCKSNLSVSTVGQSMPLDAATPTSAIQGRQSSIATTISQQTMSPMAETVMSPQSQVEPTALEQLSMSPRYGSGDSANESAAVPRELKVKRHLSDDSRFFQPPRLGPGPSTESIHFQNPFGATQPSIQEMQMHDLTHPNLPYRASEDSINLNSTAQNSMSQLQFHPPLMLPQDLPSATASSTTLVSNYQEPKFLEATPIGYNSMWNAPPTLSYMTNFDQPSADNISYISYQHPDDASMRTPSIASEQTGINVGADGTKMQNFLPLTAYPTAPFEALLPGGDEQQQFHDMNQHLT